MASKNLLSERAFWTLIDDFESVNTLTSIGKKSIKHYVNEMQRKIEDLETELYILKDEFKRYKSQQENDYDPEIEIPRIHGKGISY